MRILIAPQSLKGSLGATETGEAIARGVHAVFPDALTTIIPIADGGEGTVQALVDATGGEIRTATVTGPLNEPVEAFYGLLGDGHTAVIEMAASSGLPLVPPERRDPRLTTTFGVGELILAALAEGRRHFILGLGGSATNDGGAGMAQALGIQFFNQQQQELARGGAALAGLAHISLAKLDPRLQECHFELASDVTNPLCGPTGASAIYGPQKGATPAMIQELDAALAHYATIIQRDVQREVATIPGAGAAGGLGAGMLAFLNTTLRPGAQIILDAIQIKEYMKNTDLVISAEGQLDDQTAYGKSVGALATLAKQHNLPVLVIAGGLGDNYRGIYDLGIDAITVLPTGPMPLVYAMKHAALLTSDATERALKLFRLGMHFKPDEQ
ncbi:glycerate kinase [Dictyobacter arantiisoli]|uniref:Glycerate kinase n=1 Tax=Dictyobacter arantiisoli TaxID=2014874 RepID=A0A5A5TCR1_9CHLR|nr:glycerate kinase [Dictyobacter arantiisoli]GCF09137.1 glycerate kinase [Dictyobacter arantiisoli]